MSATRFYQYTHVFFNSLRHVHLAYHVWGRARDQVSGEVAREPPLSAVRPPGSVIATVDDEHGVGVSCLWYISGVGQGPSLRLAGRSAIHGPRCAPPQAPHRMHELVPWAGRPKTSCSVQMQTYLPCLLARHSYVRNKQQNGV